MGGGRKWRNQSCRIGDIIEGRRGRRRGAVADDSPDAAIPPSTASSVESAASWRVMRRFVDAVTGELEADKRVGRGGGGGLS